MSIGHGQDLPGGRAGMGSRPDALCMLDAQGCVTFLNPAAEQVLGWSHAELLGKMLHDVIHYQHPDGHLLPASACPLDSVLSMEAAPQERDDFLIRRDGSFVPVHCTRSPVVDGGRITGAVLVVHDLSACRQAGARLHFQATLLGQVSEGILVTDLSGRIVHWSDGARTLFGYAAEEVLGRSPALLYPEHDPAALEAGLSRIRQGHDHLGEWQGQHRAGHSVWVQLKATLLRDPAGHPAGFIGVARDITQRRRVEEERDLLLLRERAARASAERAAARARRLQAVTAALSESLTVEQVANVVIDHACEELGAAAGVLYAASEDGSELRLCSARRLAPAVREAWLRVPLEAPLPLAVAVRSGEGLWFEDGESLLSAWPELARALTPAQTPQAMVALPLQLGGRCLGGIAFSFAERTRFAPEDRELILALANHCAQAFERCRLYEAERATRTEAQRTLALLDSLLAAAPIGLGFLDRELRYLRINEVLAELNGRPAREHLGRTPGEVLPALGPALEPVLRRILETGESVLDVEVTRAGGVPPERSRHWLVDRFPVRAPGGELLGVGIAVLDITGRKEAEEAIRESEERFRLLVEGVEDCALFMLDPEGRIGSWNSGAEHILGYEAREILGQPVQRLHPPEEKEGVAGALSIAAGEGRVESAGWRVRRDGSRLWAHSTVTALRDGAGQLRGFATVLRDLTERRLAEERAEQLGSWRERVIGIVGHDLRSPVAAIKASAQALLAQGGLAAPQARGVGRICSSAGRMARMIDDLLDFTRGGLVGGIPVTRVPVDLGTLCRRANEEFELTHSGRAILLELEGDVSGEWDPDRVAQVVSNLVANALKYGAPDAPIVVAARSAGDDVVLEVRNRGVPLPAHVLPHLFDPFRNALEAGSRGRAGGLGLGLYIVQQLVRSHGGTIEVRSSQEEGTAFTVRWPRRAPA